MKKVTVTVNNNCILVRWTPSYWCHFSVSTCNTCLAIAAAIERLAEYIIIQWFKNIDWLLESQYHLHRQPELVILNWSYYLKA